MKASTLLSADERTAFGRRLRELRENAGVSKKSLIAAIGWDDSSGRLIGAYEEGRRFPTPEILRRIAAPLGVPWLYLALRAGYQRELLPALVWLHRWTYRVQLAALRVFPDNDIVGLIPKARADSLTAEGLPAEFWMEIEPDLVIPWSGFVAAVITTVAFPRRGDNLRPDSYDVFDLAIRKFPDLDPVDRALRLPLLLKRADTDLRDTSLEPATRRVLAAERVHAWMKSWSPYIYDLAVSNFRAGGGSQLSSLLEYRT